MRFLVEKLIDDLWNVLQRHPEEWRACEIAEHMAKPNAPTRVIDINKRRVIQYNGGYKEVEQRSIEGTRVLGCPQSPPVGWNKYGYSAVKEDEVPNVVIPIMERKKMNTEKPESDKTKTPAPETNAAPDSPPVTVVGTEPVKPPVVSSDTAPPDPNTEAAVDEYFAGTDDENEEEEKEVGIAPSSWSGNPKAALLFSGGIFSTATLLSLAKKGYHVTPFYVYDTNFPHSDREKKTARGIIRVAAAHAPGLIEKMQTIETKIAKSAANKRRRKYVELISEELIGHGFNNITYGKPSVYDDDADEELNSDTDIMYLQELTPLEVISPDTLEIGSLEEVIQGITSPRERKMIYSTTSCEDPGKKECGDCDTCLRRFKLLVRVWGEDKTKYMKGSQVRKMKAKISKAVEEGMALPDAITKVLSKKAKEEKKEEEEDEESDD